MKEGWVVKKLGEVCEIQGGSTPKRTERLFWENGTYPWFTVDDIREQGRVITDTKQKVTLLAWDKLRKFPKDTIMLCCTASVGEYAITKIPITSNQQFNGLVIKDKDLMSPMYLFYYVSTLKHVLKNLSGKATIDFVSAEKVRNLQISIPPLPEQSRIVEELDLLSNIIEKKRQQLSELDNLAQSIFYDMFGDPVTNEKGWEVKKLGEVYAINPSKKITLIGIEGDDMVSFLPMEDLPIKACYVTPKQNRTCNEVMSSYTCFANNDVLLAKVTPCFENGKVGIASNLINGVGFGSSEFIVIRPKELAVKEYVYHLVQTDNFVEKACKQFTGTSGLRRVPKQFVEQLKIGIPPLSLQQFFARKIEAIEKQKALIKQSIAETEELFNSRMDYYFS